MTKIKIKNRNLSFAFKKLKLAQCIRYISHEGVQWSNPFVKLPVRALALSSLITLPTYAQDNILEEVTVTGIRSSLESAANLKENADGVVDAISAEDIGKFPDSNVAESLQRITGVAITRGRGGDGQFVTIRGLGEEFNAVTFNGRLLATENRGREFSFDVIASELIRTATVNKTSIASLGDGSIGGRVNVETAKPLDDPGLHIAGSVASQYDELSDEFGPKFSGIVSNSFNDDTLGALFSFAYQKRDLRSDVAEALGFFEVDVDTSGSIDDPNDAIPIAPGGEGLFIPALSVLSSPEERERYSGTFALQWQPNINTDITFDALYSHYESPATAVGYSIFPFDASLVEPGSVQFNDAGAITNATYRSAPDGSNFLVNDFLARSTESDADTIALGLNGKFQINERLSLTGDISWSNADGTRDDTGSDDGSGRFFVVGVRGAEATISPGDEVPNLSFTGPDSLVTDAASLAAANQVPLDQLDPDNFRAHFARDSSFVIDDEIFSIKLDGLFEFDEETSLQFGFDFTDREKESRAINNNPTNCFFCGYNTALRDVNPEVFDAFFANGAPTNDPDILDATSANIARSFVTFDADFLEELYAGSAIPGASDALVPLFRPAESTVVEETVIGAYFQANLAGELGGIPWNGNAGVRFAYTESESIGAQNQIIGRIDQGAGNQTFLRSEATPVSFSNEYFDVLPSFNINFTLDDGLYLRAAWSQSLTRPTLTDLSTAFSIPSTNVGLESISRGNPELDPIRADNFDLSLEYFGDRVNASAAVFYKTIDGFVSNVTTPTLIDAGPSTDQDPNNNIPDGTVTDQSFFVEFDATQPENSDNADVYGLELAGQYLWDSGWGMLANITFADSSVDGLTEQTSTLENISDVSWNVSAFYENYGFSTRLSVNNRGDYVQTTVGESGFTEVVDEYMQIDFTASYEISDSLTVFFEGINLGDEALFVYSGTRSRLQTFEENGRRFALGIRGSF